MAPDADATTPPRDDTELMCRVQRGDEAALGTLMQRWERPVKSVIARLVLNAREAEDLAQETFVRVWQQRGKFRPDAEFRPWIFSIAVNIARNRLRWWRSRPEVALEEWTEGASETESGATAAERRERAEAVRTAVAALPAELREALVLSVYEQMPHAEIALALGATIKAVETRIARARARLRQALPRMSPRNE
ncbi:MAG: sigma-70 family RNA polymerase sigma factor [Opitutaceae bacterium]